MPRLFSHTDNRSRGVIKGYSEAFFRLVFIGMARIAILLLSAKILHRIGVSVNFFNLLHSPALRPGPTRVGFKNKSAPNHCNIKEYY